MPLGLLWSERGRDNLRDILDYIASDSPTAAVELKLRIDEAIVPVLDHPYLFRSGRKRETREIVAHPNILWSTGSRSSTSKLSPFFMRGGGTLRAI